MSTEKIIDLKNVQLKPRSHRMHTIKDVTFNVGAGEVAIVRLENDSEYLPLCDLVEGLLEPDEGSVNFLGESWQAMSPWHQGEMRAKIGRVFESDGWVSNLSVYENVTLAERHHTLRKESEILDEVGKLCSKIGLESVPDQRPDFTGIGILRKSEWIRAFLGVHRLVLLERPEEGVNDSSIPLLFTLIRDLTANGGAILWTTVNQRVWDCRAFERTIRFEVHNGSIQQAGE